ncbi:MAG: hypothetical protein SF172_18020, partial [Burkholderiales bacterium]|nr:hypothetical protein [Burkholderiales bacterium]
MLHAIQGLAQTCSVADLNLSGVVNTYWAGTGTLAAGSTSVTLGAQRSGTDSITGLSANTTSFAVNDMMLIIQMQDADINTTNTDSYGDGVAGGVSSGYSNIRNTGLFHFARVTSVGGSIGFTPATTAEFRTAAAVSGASGQRSYQVIRVPFSRNVTLTGTVRPMSWNGSTGGVVAIEAGQNLVLNAGVDAAGLGFRGGGGHGAGGQPSNVACCPGNDGGAALPAISYVGALPNAANTGGRAAKGEGVAGTPRLVDRRESSTLLYGYTTTDNTNQGYPFNGAFGDFGRGAPGNAGGGGNRHDSGGGGGGNGGPGGKGGGAYDDGSDFGGYGGTAITGFSGDRVFLGGGGGSGQGWHTPPTTGSIPILSGGGRGGGIVMLRGDVVSGSATLDVRGQSGFGMPTNLGGCNFPLDATALRGLGGEGAGAGGSAFLIATSSGLGSVSVDASGGNGGNAGHCDTNLAGPGGGGGGGRVVFFSPTTAPSSNVNGGAPGVVAFTNVAPGALPGTGQAGSGNGGTGSTLASAPASPCAAPDLTVAKTIASNVTPGQTGATYSIVVSNDGSGPKTAGSTVSVVDTLPAGFTATALSGTGWTCVLGTLTCTRTDALAAGSSYPSITLTFNAANNLPGNTAGTLTNTVNVTLTGQTESNAGNNSGTRVTPVTSIYKSVRVTADPDSSGLANPTVGDTLTWSIFVSNPAGAFAVSNFQVTDVLPAGVTITAAGAQTITQTAGACGVLPTLNGAYNGSGTNTLLAAAQTLPANCTVRIDIPTTISTTGIKSNQPTISGTGLATATSDAIDLTTPGASLPTGVAALANSLTQVQVVGIRDPTLVTPSYPAPTLAKTFNPAGLTPGNSSVLTVTITNTGAVPLTAAGFTDTYPAGLVNATSPNGTSSCGGTVTAVAGGGSLVFSGGTVPASGVCTITVNVTITGNGTYVNTIPAGNLTTGVGVTNTAPATASLYTNPTITKSFSPGAVAPNADSTLTLVLANPNTAALTISNPGLTDPFPANLVATGGTVTYSGAGCTGFAPASIAANATSFVLTGGTIPAGSSCTITFAVRSAIAGTYNNTTSGLTTVTTGSTGPVSNTASLSVGLISITKFFGPNQIQSGGTSTITYTLTNPTATLQTAGTFLDTMVNMSIAAPGGAAGGTCVGAAGNSFVTGATSLNFTGLQIPASGSCTVTVVVTSSVVGTLPNAANGVTTALLSQGPGSNTDNLIVIGKPTISKAFSPSGIVPTGTSTMTLTLTNPNTIPLTGVNFTDTYPANLVNATPLTTAGTCTGVTTTATAGGGNFNVTAATLPASASCTITVLVTSAVAGVYNNSTSGVASTQSGSAGTASNVATLTVSSPATITKAFGTSPISQGGTSVITFTLTNPNASVMNNLNFTDALVNMTVSSATIGGTCAGVTNSPALVVGATSLNLTVPTLAASSNCTITVTITSNVSGTHPNTTSGVTSTQTPVAGPASNTANLVVLSPPTLTKSFAPTQIQTGGTSTITFTLTNPNPSSALTNVTFTDPLFNMTVANATAGGTCAGESFSPVLSVGGTQINPTVPTLAGGASCTITVQVTSTSISIDTGHANITSSVTSTQTPTGSAGASASLIVLAPPVVTKNFLPNYIGTSQTTTLQFTLTNPNPVALTGVTFFDGFPTTPANMTVATPLTTTNSCGGTLDENDAADGDNTLEVNDRSIRLTGGNLAAGGSCTVSINVTAGTAGDYTNNITLVSSTQTPTAIAGGTDFLTVGQMQIQKQFCSNAPAALPADSVCTPVTDRAINTPFFMWITIFNPGIGNNQNNLHFNDTLPSGMQTVAGDIFISRLAGQCDESPNPIPNEAGGATTFNFNAGRHLDDLDNNGACIISVSVLGTTAGLKNNTVTGTNAGGGNGSLNGSTDSASVRIWAPPTVAKTFTPSSIGVGGVSVLRITLSNPAANPGPMTGVAVTDVFPVAPGAMTVSSLSTTNTCGGSLTDSGGAALNVGDVGVRLAGATIPLGGSCYIEVQVTAPVAGVYNNSIPAGSLTSTYVIDLTGANAALTVTGPALTKAFSPNLIQRGTTSRLTFTITNAAGNPAQPLVEFTDSLPANLLVASPANASTTCTGGSASAVSGSGTVTLSGASMLSGTATCEVGVDVTSSVTGSYLNNSTNISGTSTGLNTAGVNATLTVQNNATLTKAFSPTSIGAGGTSVLTFTITNGAGAQGYSGQGFSDSLPAGLVVAGTPGVVNTCGGTVTATAGSGTISLANGSISAAPATCTVSVNVTSASLGNYVNNSTNISGLTGGLTATGVNATLQVVGTALTKAFSPTEIGRGGVSTLTFTITNGAGNPTQTGLGFIENLPANVFVAGAPSVTNTCGGTVTAVAGAGTITLSGGTITSPAANCTFSVNVTSSFVGSYFNGPSRIVNPTSTMDVSGVNATLNVLENPTVSKTFSPSSMPLNGTSTLTITVTNANAVPMAGLQVTDVFPNLPAQMSLANVTTSNTCGGTLTDSGGGALNVGDVGVRVTGGSVAANSSCVITVNVTAATAGAYTNTIAIGGVQTANAGVNSTAGSAILNVLAPPTVTKSYAPNPVVAGGTSVLTITINNPNSFASMTGVAFTDTNPTNLLNTATPAGNSTCGGTVTANASGTSVALSGGTIPASGSCVITVNQSAATAGAYANTIAIGDVTTTNAGSNTAAANATLNVYSPPTISKAFGGNIGPGGSTTLTFTLTNPVANPGALTGIGFTDLFPTSPAAMTLASVTTSSTCTGATILDGGGGALNVGDSGIQVSGIGPLAAGASCTLQVTITAPTAGSYNNTSGTVSASGPLSLTGGTAAATLTVVQPTLTKAFTGPLTVGGTTTLVFTLTNGAGNPAQSSLSFVDTLRSGLAVAGTPNVQSNCPAGGALVASPAFVTTGASTITVTNAAMNAGVASCEIRVNLTTSATPTVGTCPQADNTNAAADISGVNRLTNSIGTQCVNVTAAVPAVDKAFSGAVTVGGTTTLTFTITQPTGNPTQTFSFTDTLPAGLLVGTGAVGGTCSGGTVTATAGTNSITVSGRQIVNPATSCTITVPITTTTTPTVATCPQAANTNANANLSALTNLTASIQNSAAGGGTSGGGACVTVNPATPVLDKVFSGGLTVGGTVTLTFTISQPAGNPTQTFSFVDTLPSGLAIGAGALGGTCTGGSITATPGTSTITVTNRQIVNPATSCTITVPVTTSATATVATCPNSNNTNGNADISGRVNLSSNIALTAAGGGTSAGGACISVAAAVPALTKAFSPTSIGSGETSTLTFTVTQPTGNPTQTFSFTDTLPAGLLVGSGAVGGTCSGGTVTATAGTSTITVSNRQIVNPATSCTITVPVTLSASPVTTACPVAGNTNGNANISAVTNLTNNVSDQCLTVVLPSLTKAFGSGTIDDSVPTSLVFTLTNGSGNPAQSGLGWTETLPANIRFTAASLPVAYSAGCSGPATVTATGGPPLNQIALSGLAMTAGTTSCTVTVGVNGTSGVTNVASQFNGSCAGNPAAFTNTSANITGATRVTSSVTPQCLVVNARPTLTKSFGANPQTIGVGQTATLTFTINNTAASSIARSGLAFTDTLPGAGGITATASTPQCGGGTVSVTGGNVIAVSGASVAAGASCTITATVTGVTAGSYVNGPTNGSITGVSSNLNNGVTDQTLNVRQPTLTKSFGSAAIDDAVATSLVFTLTNGTGNPAQSGLGWTETLPANT